MFLAAAAALVVVLKPGSYATNDDEGKPIPPSDHDPRKAIEELVPVQISRA